MTFLNECFRRIGIYLIIIILAISFFNINGFFNNKKSEIIKSDGLGYYSYLPAIFIYNDYKQDFLKQIFSNYYEHNGLPEYMQIIDGKPVNKYFFGVAILISPFFWLAHILSYFLNLPTDGYSILYQYCSGLSAVFYIFIGILFCDKLLRIYGATTFQSLFICSFLIFATNIYYYSVIEPIMSHSFSFGIISAFLFYAKSIIKFEKSKYIIPAFISLGLIILIRPFNVLIILILPFLGGGFNKIKESINFLLRNYYITILGTLFLIILISLQFIIWYKQNGHFINYSYKDEKFYFDNPNIIKALFSYHKGFFIYTPILFLTCSGFIYLFLKNCFKAFSLFIFFFILIYLMSCWHVWYYGASYGYRPLIDYYSLFSLLFLFTLKLLKNKVSKVGFFLLCLCTLYVNQIQAYQYRKYILYGNGMSYYKYWRVFLSTDDKWIGYVWDNPEVADYTGTTVSTFANNFEHQEEKWQPNIISDIGQNAFSGSKVTVLDSNNIFSSTLVIQGDEKIADLKRMIVVARGYIKKQKYLDTDKLKFVISYQKPNNEVYYYKTRMVDNLFEAKNGWLRFEIAKKVDGPESLSDIIKVYFWNPDKQIFLIDDLSVEFVKQQ